MGNFHDTLKSPLWKPDLEFYDYSKDVPKFDPMLGFPNGRKLRTVKATEEEIISVAVPLEQRDYCVDYYIDFMACKRENLPFPYKCAPQMHAYTECEFADHTLRMKEYEREKRLKNLVEERKKQQAQ